MIAQFPGRVGCKELAYDQFEAVDIDKNWVEWMGGDAIEVKKPTVYQHRHLWLVSQHTSKPPPFEEESPREPSSVLWVF